MKKAALLACCAGALFTASSRAADNPFAEIIRKTQPLPPEQEQKAFHLPPGFQIDLVVAEPEIGKPINLAFDDKGRLWLTQSREYPFPAPLDRPGRDKIQVLSDFAPDGRAGKVTPFAEGLNIPIGMYPYLDGALAYSIPNIYFFHDTNGDGHADTKELFLGRFGFERDTHGMTSSFRRGFDGWLYANHGFNNTSTLTAKDGSSITMQSGNTYRVKIDGSHIEQFTWGRVNPFGLMFDPLGNAFSSDCETLPIYQLLRGGYYPSFGKPDDGLGFAPPMMDHKHGSTAIAGTVYYAATNFPPEFRDNIFVGNVMTCRIDRDSLERHGSTSIAKEEPDFLSCDDPWFRPVDLELGPDGALYVADFYNRIIGHYEVPLTNPGRDRERGRIWRISYHGTEPQTTPDLSKASTSELIQQLGNSNITLRMLAMNELTNRVGPDAIKPVIKMMHSKKSSVFQRIHGLWVLYRANALDAKLLASVAHDPDSRLRVHAMRVYAETKEWTTKQHALVIVALNDPDALVERCAADALGQHPDASNIRPLLDAHHRVPEDDTHLLYVIRMALRNQLRVEENFALLPKSDWSQADDSAVADVCPSLNSPASAEFLMRHLREHSESHDVSAGYLRHIARYLPESSIDSMAQFVREKFAGEVDFQFTLFTSAQEGWAERGVALPESARKWGVELARQLLAANERKHSDWWNIPIPGLDPANPWHLRSFKVGDGRSANFLASDEQFTGILRSPTFVIPANLKFLLVGHDGYPNQRIAGKNFIRLRDAATGEILMNTPPPRSDVPREIKWDLKEYAGKKGYIEIVDGNATPAYAWLAAGRFSPRVVAVPKASPNEQDSREKSAADLAGSLRLTEMEEPLSALLSNSSSTPDGRIAAAKALAQINPDGHVAELGALLANAAESLKLQEQCADSLGAINLPGARDALAAAMKTAPQLLQMKIALALASTTDGAKTLFTAVAEGKASARLLQNANLRDRLLASKSARVEERLAQLTKGLPPADAERQRLIDKRAAAFNKNKASAVHGAELFKKTCMVCHSMDNQGALIGPHLDGVGLRGVPRLVEDILDPSRNVDRAFRVSLFIMKDGDVQSGLFRREEGEMVVVADSTGKENLIPKKDIAERRESELSLMPDNFSQVLKLSDFNDILAYLVSKGGKAPGTK